MNYIIKNLFEVTFVTREIIFAAHQKNSYLLRPIRHFSDAYSGSSPTPGDLFDSKESSLNHPLDELIAKEDIPKAN